MENLTASTGDRCQLCYQLTPINNYLCGSPSIRSRPKLGSHLMTYLYHDNLKGPFLPSTSEPVPPKLTFTISTAKSEVQSPSSPLVCEECERQLEKLDKLHQQLESVKKSIDLQIKLINRKRLLQQSILEDDDDHPTNLNDLVSPGLSMTGASIGKENIYQTLTLLNSICEGIPSTTPCAPLSKKIKRNGSSSPSAVIQPKKVSLSIEADPLEIEETPTTFVKTELDTSASLQMEMYGEFDDNFEGDQDDGGHAYSDANIQPSAYGAPSDAVVLGFKEEGESFGFPDLNGDLDSNVKVKANKVVVKRGQGNRPQKMCPDCGKLISARNFALHQRIHTRETPHVCEHCHKGFIQLNDLKRHLASVHLEEGNLECGVCGKKGFIFKYDLKRHMERQHNY